MIFKHIRDWPILGAALVQIALWIWCAVHFSELGVLALFALAVIIASLQCTNFQVIAHNHIHNPLFNSSFANFIFSALNSLNLGVPSSFYTAHHMNHHQYGNGDGDSSSLLANGKNGKEEAFWRYSLLSPLRTDFAFLYKLAKRLGLKNAVIAESAFFLAVCFLGLASCTKFFLFFAVPTLYLGQVLASAENFLEHARSPSADNRRNSVSCYGRFYNWIWLNNGYHQEHHFRPKLHWSQLPEITKLLPADRNTYPGSHWFSLVQASSSTFRSPPNFTKEGSNAFIET